MSVDLSTETLLGMTKEQLIELLQLAVQGQEQATLNVQKMVTLLQNYEEQCRTKEAKIQQLEAEIVFLRNTP